MLVMFFERAVVEGELEHLVFTPHDTHRSIANLLHLHICDTHILHTHSPMKYTFYSHQKSFKNLLAMKKAAVEKE